jgi:hypothetical protein
MGRQGGLGNGKGAGLYKGLGGYYLLGKER